MYESLVAALLLAVGGSSFTWAFTAIAKAIPQIPVVSGETGKITLVRIIAGTLFGLAAAYLSNGMLDPTMLQGAASVILTAVASFIGSHYVHKGIQAASGSKLNPPPYSPT